MTRTSFVSCGWTVVFFVPPPGSPQVTRSSVPIGSRGSTVAQREGRALVRAVAGEHRGADDGAVGVEHGVEVRRAVVRDRQVEELVARARRGRRCWPGSSPRSSSFQASVTFLRCVLGVDLLERLAPDEVVVELHACSRSPAPTGSGSSPRCRRRRSSRRARSSPRSPCAGSHSRYAAQLLAGVDRGQRRGDPARLQRVRRVGARAAGLDAELARPPRGSRRGSCRALVRSPELEPGRARHAVAQRAHLLAADVHRRPCGRTSPARAGRR